jgi:protein-S-isoprenylcysteine O-methyltransferase Ste14
MWQRLELKVPPPIVALIVAIAMRVAAGHIAAGDDIRTAVAIAIALLGASCDIAAMTAFFRARTTINPLQPQSSSALVTSGIYRHTRNPMYVGLVLFLCAWAVWLASWLAWLGPIVFAAYIARFQIAPEERALATRFGDAYRAYQAQVRRWI